MEQWWKRNERYFPELMEEGDDEKREARKKHIEDLTGRIPEFLFEYIGKTERDFLRSAFANAVGAEVLDFYRNVVDHDGAVKQR